MSTPSMDIEITLTGLKWKPGGQAGLCEFRTLMASISGKHSWGLEGLLVPPARQRSLFLPCPSPSFLPRPFALLTIPLIPTPASVLCLSTLTMHHCPQAPWAQPLYYFRCWAGCSFPGLHASSFSDAGLTQLGSLPSGSLPWLNLHPDWISCPSFHSYQVSVTCRHNSRNW